MASAFIAPLAAAGVVIADPGEGGPAAETTTSVVETSTSVVETSTTVVETSTSIVETSTTVVETSTTEPVTTESPSTSAPDENGSTVPESTIAETTDPVDTSEPGLVSPMLMAASSSVPAPTCTVSVPVHLGTSLGAWCVETRLKQLGWYSGVPDDVFDWNPAYMLGVWQPTVGLPATSVADKATLQALEIWSEPAAPTCTLSYPVRLDNSLGGRCVTTRLAQLGVYVGPITDVFGWHAAYTLGLVQESYGMPRTSVADRATLAALGIWSDPAPTCFVFLEIRLGSTAGARCAETRMRQIGILGTAADDVFDWHSAYTLGLFQANVGITPTSVGDSATLQALGIWRSAPAASCTVGSEMVPGQRSDDVTCLERRLVEFGLFAGTPDTYFDWDTFAAVQSFQQAKGFPESGNATAATLIALGIFDASKGNPLPVNSGSGRRLVYSRPQQRVWAVDDTGAVVKTHRVSGRLREPYAGTYSVYSRSLHTYAAGNPSIRWMYMVRFAYGPSGGRIGFHEIPNQNGRPLQTVEQLGLPLSGGCVRQSTPDAVWVWNWAPVGTKVVVL